MLNIFIANYTPVSVSCFNKSLKQKRKVSPVRPIYSYISSLEGANAPPKFNFIISLFIVYW